MMQLCASQKWKGNLDLGSEESLGIHEPGELQNIVSLGFQGPLGWWLQCLCLAVCSLSSRFSKDQAGVKKDQASYSNFAVTFVHECGAGFCVPIQILPSEHLLQDAENTYCVPVFCMDTGETVVNNTGRLTF